MTQNLSTEANDDENTLEINEEVRTIEYAPACFQAIREMDDITNSMI